MEKSLSRDVKSKRGGGLQAPLYTRSVPIHDVNCEAVHLAETIQVEIEFYTQEVLAKVPELDLWASEATESEALLSIKQAICELWDELRSMDDEQLGKLPKMWKRILLRKLRSDARP